MKRLRFRHRYVRDLSEDSIDEELERRTVKSSKWMAYSGALHVNEEEELVRAQRDMERWKYQGLKTYEEPADVMVNGARICVRAFWITVSLLPLVLLLVLIGLLSLLWKQKSSSTKQWWRRTGDPPAQSAAADNDSTYLRF
ncbi:unnamed protein product [Gongylonema pulchrum]|uniref:Transmembrane protein n=1 Tax=Gongylonema pulchrum TaxID=637853 RepID=A0A183DAL9_9BILA|nr:unnamed protein product [Gongylonema pulchrum]